MPFRPIIPLLPLPKTGILSRLTAPDHTPEIANALLLADFPRAASLIANAGPDALDKARPKLNQLLEDILVQIASRAFQPEGLTESSRGVKRGPPSATPGPPPPKISAPRRGAGSSRPHNPPNPLPSQLMPFRPIIPLLPLPKTGILSRLTAPDHTPEIANALLLADFPRGASLIANAGPDALDKARPKLNQLLEDILVQIASDGRFEADEREYIQSFVKAAAIPKSECQRIYALAMKRALTAAIDHAIADGNLFGPRIRPHQGSRQTPHRGTALPGGVFRSPLHPLAL